MKKFKLKKKYKKLIFNIIISLLVLVFLFSMYKVLTIIYYDHKNIKETEKLIEEVVKKVDDDKDNNDKNDEDSSQYEIDFDTLRERNPDVVGWIMIPNTNINYPIVQGDDNSYYLTRNIDKEYNRSGMIFMNYKNSRDFSDNNTILFGHNTTNNTMFGELKKIYNKELGEEVNIYIYVGKVVYRYQVYSAYYAEAYDPIPLYMNTKFFEKSDKKFKYNKTDLETLTLSTCHTNRVQRLIIHALKQEVF